MASGGNILWILTGDLIAIAAAIVTTFLLLVAAEQGWLSARRAGK
jgi:hypothetical protein